MYRTVSSVRRPVALSSSQGGKAMGVLMILFAVLIATDGVNQIALWMLETFPQFQTI
ncbi:MAG: hypothetical protein ABJL99_06790 [Aliishimia sp.]